MPADGGDGLPMVKLTRAQAATEKKVAARTASDPSEDPQTGVDLGAGPGAGKITGEDKGSAKDIAAAAREA